MEMGDHVDEIYIVEGETDWQGAPKKLGFEEVMKATPILSKWRHKLTYIPLKIPRYVLGYALQEYQRLHAINKMPPAASGSRDTVILEGDLDEVVNQRVLEVLRHCEPSGGEDWDASIRQVMAANGVAHYGGNWDKGTIAHFAGSPMAECTFSTGKHVFSDKQMADAHIYCRRRAPTTAPTAASSAAPRRLNWRVGKRVLGPLQFRYTGWHFGWTLNGAEGLAHKYWTQKRSFEGVTGHYASILVRGGIVELSFEPGDPGFILNAASGVVRAITLASRLVTPVRPGWKIIRVESTNISTPPGVNLKDLKKINHKYSLTFQAFDTKMISNEAALVEFYKDYLANPDVYGLPKPKVFKRGEWPKAFQTRPELFPNTLRGVQWTGQ